MDNTARADYPGHPARRVPVPDTGGTLIGRAKQLRALENCANDVRTGYPCVIRLTGATGAGKTTLLRTATSGLADFATVWVACHPVEYDDDLNVATEIVTGLVQSCADRGMPSPELGRLPADPTGIRRVLADLLHQVQQHFPVAVVVDDAENTDEASLNALGQLVRRLRAGRVLLVFALGRDDAPALPSAGKPSAGRAWYHLRSAAAPIADLHVDTLDEADSLALATRLLGHEPGPVQRKVLREYAAGNPALIGALVAEDAEDMRSTTLPGPLLDHLAARLAALSERASSLLQAVAVLDGHTRLALATGVSDIDEPADALEELLAGGLVQWEPMNRAVPVRIADPLLGRAVNELMGPRQRRDLHRRAASLVTGESRWYHRAAAAIGVDPALTAELLDEAATMAKRGDIDRAVKYLRQAADVDVSVADRERMLQIAAILAIANDDEATAAELLPSVQEAEPGQLRSCVFALLDLAETGGGGAAAPLLASEADLTGPTAPRWVAVVVNTEFARAHLGREESRLAMARARVALEHPAEASVRTVVSAARCWLMATLFTDGPVVAAQAFNSIRGIVERRTTRADVLLAAEHALLHMVLGRFSLAANAAQLSLDASADQVGQEARQLALLVLFDARFMTGQWDAAEEVLRTGLAANTGSKRWWPLLALHTRAAMLTACQGKWSEAEKHIQHIESGARPHDWTTYAVHLATARAYYARARGDAGAVVAAFDDLRRASADREISGPALALESFWRPVLLAELVQHADPQVAEKELSRLLSLGHSATHVRGQLAWMTARLAERHRDLHAASRLYAQAVNGAETADTMPLECGQADYAYGQFLLRLGDKRGAMAAFAKARNRFLRIGAVPFAARCAEVIQSTRPSRGAALALTEREREVANLVSAGLTNNQAASRLFVSEKTIEFHLGNVYSKLGISSRRQLRESAAQVDGDGAHEPKHARREPRSRGKHSDWGVS